VFLFDVGGFQPIDRQPDGELARPVSKGCEMVTWVTFSPDGTLLAATDDSGIWVWDEVGHRLLGQAAIGESMPLCCTFSPDSTMMAVSDSTGAVHLWRTTGTTDSHRLQPVGRLKAEAEADGAANSVAFHPDGHMLAAAYESGVVRLWDPVALDALGVLSGSDVGAINDVAFHPGGRVLATANADHSARLWDLAGRRVERRLLGHAGVVWSVAFHPGGHTLATGSDDGTVRLWDLGP
jgi:WD40 repeat protein